MTAGREDSQSRDVFLNVPFDSRYEPLFVALIATIVSARMVPRCAVELPERGEGQLRRILSLMERCSLTIHDLSRRDRFNMPFELGLAVGLERPYIVMEAGTARHSRVPSDLRGAAPIQHRNRPRLMISQQLDNLGGARPADADRIHRRLMKVAPTLKRTYRAPDLFRTAVFRELVSGAVEEAERMKLF
jgi:hypothetical protein